MSKDEPAELRSCAPDVNEEVFEDIASAYIDMKAMPQAVEIYEMLHLRNVHSLHYRLKLAWLYLLCRADNKGMALLAPRK